MSTLTEQLLDAYQQAINEIDDYFEYGEIDPKVKQVVMGIIDDLALKISALDAGHRYDITEAGRKALERK